MALKPHKATVETDDDRTKPPFLRRVRIRGYKSIAFCDVELQPLTVLVGRNAAGKSNFLDALAFLSDLMDQRTTKAANERKGWMAIHCRTSRSPLIEFEVSAALDSYKSLWEAEYSFSLELGKQNQIRVRREELALTDHGHDRRCGFRFADEGFQWIGRELFEHDAERTSDKDTARVIAEGKFPDPTLFTRRRYDRLLLSVIGTQPFLDLSEGLRASGIYNFHPPAMRELQPTTGSPILTRDGRNLARAIEGLKEIEPEALDRVRAYLNTIVREIAQFKTVKRGDFETVRFRMAADHGRKPLQFDASGMSDGTLRVLGALIAAFQIVLPSGYPGFVAIEEPETALHPAAMRALVNALSEATGRTQILLSTHSAELLDNPTIRPENVRVVQMIDGQTVIAPVDEASVDIVCRELNTLGGLERENLLEPNLDTLELQRRLGQSQQESSG